MKLIEKTISIPDRVAMGKVARAERLAAGLSLAEMARRMDMFDSHLSNLELGRLPWTKERIELFNACLMPENRIKK